MNFGLVQSGMLWGLLALAIPFLVHLLFRQKPQDVPIGSIRFLKEIMEKHRNRQRVMRWVLMSLRMAGLALLAMLFARPFMSEAVEGKRGEKFVAILIDRSASMQLKNGGERLIDSAINAAKAVLRKESASTRFEVAFFDYEVASVLGDNDKQGGAESREILARLEAPNDTFAATDYAAALRWAHDVCTTSNAMDKELHVFTDLQQSGLAWSEVAPMPADVKVRVHDLGRDLPNNVAITSTQVSQLVIRPGESATVTVSLLNDGPFPFEELPVVLELKNGNRSFRERRKLKLESGSIESVEFAIERLEEGLWQGTASVELIDDLQFDNSRHLAIMSTPQYSVLIIDGQPSEEDVLTESHYLTSAIRLAPEGGSFSASPYLPSARSNNEPLSAYDVIVIANAKSIGSSDATRISEFVDGGGGVVFFGGDQVTNEGYASVRKAGLLPGEIVAPRESFDLPWRIENWNRKHPIFEPFADPQSGDLTKLAFRGRVELELAPDATVLASYGDGQPFLVEKKLGVQGGTILWVTTSCDGEWSNWTQSELYVPIIHQLLGQLTGLNSGGPVRESTIDSTDAMVLTSQTPGVFKQEKFWQVVNVAPRESEMERSSVNDFVNRFELRTSDTEDEQPVASRGFMGNPKDVRQDEMWHWILFALLVVMVSEFLISNRTTA